MDTGARFEIEAEASGSSGGRIGTVHLPTAATATLATPAALLWTFRGLVQYVPPDVLGHATPPSATAPPALAMAVGHAASLLPPNFAGSAAEFVMHSGPLVGMVREPGGYNMDGKRTAASVSLDAPEGRVQMTVEAYADLMARLRLDLAELLVDDPAPGAGKRRSEVSLANSRAMWAALAACPPVPAVPDGAGPLFLLRVGGGDYAALVAESIDHVADMLSARTPLLSGHAAGVIIPDLRTVADENGAPAADAMLARLDALLPPAALRLNEAAVTPLDVLHAVRDGRGDLFYASYPTTNAELGYAIVLSLAGGEHKAVNVHDVANSRDAAPLVAGCPCYACTHHSRAYIHHLLVVHEMLGIELLLLHNHAVFATFLADIRSAIAAGSSVADLIATFLAASHSHSPLPRSST